MRRTRSRHVGRSVLSGATTPNRNCLVMSGLLSFGLSRGIDDGSTRNSSVQPRSCARVPANALNSACACVPTGFMRVPRCEDRTAVPRGEISASGQFRFGGEGGQLLETAAHRLRAVLEHLPLVVVDRAE